MNTRRKFNLKITQILTAGLILVVLAAGCAEQKPGGLSADQKVNLANTFYNNELYEAAIAEYQQYLSAYDVDSGKQANVYYQIANIYFERLHDYDKALENYLRIKYLYPESNLQSEVGKKIVSCLERLERSQDAQRVLEKETALKPEEVTESRPGEVIATIGKRQITQGDLDFEIGQLPPYMQTQIDSREKKHAFLQQFLAEELLYDSAKRQNLDQDKQIIQDAFRAKKNLMAQKILQDEIGKLVDIKPADVELYYKANKEKYSEKGKDGKVLGEKPFSEVSDQVARDLFQEKQQTAYQQLIERLMKAENVTIYDKRIN